LRGRGVRFGRDGVESTPPSTMPSSTGALAAMSIGGRVLIGRLSLESHCGRSGSFFTSAKISASCRWSSVSFSISALARLSRMSRLSLRTCQASSCAC
jgi:hypothetical protein